MPDRYVVIGRLATVAAAMGRDKRPGSRPARARGLGARVLAGLAVWGALGCASPGSEIHLEPLFARIHTADGGTSNEALGGLYRDRRDADDGFLEWRTLAPLWGVDRQRNGDFVAYHPFPLGITNRRHGERFSMLVPLYIWSHKLDRYTQSMGWKLAFLPGILMQSTEAEGFAMGWFPFLGRFRDFLTFDKLIFIAWPLFVYSEREGRVSYNIPWPIFGWTRGNGEHSHHLFPLYQKASIEGRYDRYSFLWPLFHYGRNYLPGDPEQPETSWMLFPLLGRKTRGSYHSTTLLWPLFGYAANPEEGFWALDLPFPLVRFQRGEEVHRSRIWPFGSFTEADDLRTTAILWPLIQFRHEDGGGYERDSTYVIPFWSSSTRRDTKTGETRRRRRLWPLFQYETEGTWSHGFFPQVNPLRRSPLLRRFVTRPLHLWEWEKDGELVRERAWLGLYRRERGRGEDRRSLSFLWSRRKVWGDGADRKETSILFGLLRWRTGSDGFALLRPAFPGPGWPEPAGAPAGKARTYF